MNLKPKFKIKFARDEDMLRVSYGEVYSFKAYGFKSDIAVPVPNGLFCQKIFGPIRDYTCACGRLMPRFMKECPDCHVSNVKSSERGRRFGHINAVLHYINPLVIKIISGVLGLNQKTLTEISLGRCYFRLKKIPNDQYSTLVDVKDNKWIIETEDLEDGAEVYTSIESLYNELKKADINGIRSLRLSNVRGAKNYFEEGYSLFDFFNTIVLVPPPLGRDISIVDGSITYHPVNNLYLRVLRQGLRAQHIKEADDGDLKELLPREACILQHIINMLYLKGAVDYYGSQIPPIIDTLIGKGGLIRGNLLGKRVDFSARSVISSGPELPLDTVGLPFDMAYELLKPYIIHIIAEDYIDEDKIANPYKEAYRSYKNKDYRAQCACYDAAKDATVLMNRAPSLHRYSVMAFKVELHSGKWIKFPPMACSPFNADFDGDTLAVHLILTDQANNEAYSKLRLTDNIMSSICDNKPNVMPAHEQIIGLYELTK